MYPSQQRQSLNTVHLLTGREFTSLQFDKHGMTERPFLLTEEFTNVSYSFTSDFHVLIGVFGWDRLQPPTRT